jgi:hypothetical protein
MSELRKVRRTMEKLNRPKRPAMTSIMLLIGGILLFIGIILSGTNYLYSTGSRPVLPGSDTAEKQAREKQELETSSRDMTILGASAAGLGLILAGTGGLVKFVQKKIKERG